MRQRPRRHRAFSLSDDQMQAVMIAAQTLPVAARDGYLSRIASKLQRHPGFANDSLVQTVISAVLEELSTRERST